MDRDYDFCSLCGQLLEAGYGHEHDCLGADDYDEDREEENHEPLQ